MSAVVYSIKQFGLEMVKSGSRLYRLESVIGRVSVRVRDQLTRVGLCVKFHQWTNGYTNKGADTEIDPGFFFTPPLKFLWNIAIRSPHGMDALTDTTDKRTEI